MNDCFFCSSYEKADFPIVCTLFKTILLLAVPFYEHQHFNNVSQMFMNNCEGWGCMGLGVGW